MKLTTAAVIIAVAAVPAIALAQPAIKPSPSSPVTVTNTASNPVPVTGDVTSTVSGSVQITNSVGNAVPVQVTNGPVLQPVQRTVFGSFDTGQRFSDDVTLYTVPNGKVFVLDTVTTGSNMSPNDRFFHSIFSFDSGGVIPFGVYVQPVAEGVFSSTGANIFNKTQAATAYAGPGTSITARASRDGTSLSSTAVLFSIAGHLVDAQ